MIFPENIFSHDEAFVKHLTQNRNVFQKVFDNIKYMLKYVTAGSHQEKDLLRIKHTFEKAWREAYKAESKAQSDTKYNLERAGDTEYVKSEKGRFLKEDGTLASEKEVFDSLVGQTLHLSDGDVKIVKNLPGKRMYDELYRRQPKYKKDIEDVKRLNSDVNYNMEELLTNSKTIAANEPDVDNRHQDQGITAFDTRRVNFYDGTKAYNIEFSVGILENGEKVAYAKKFYGYDAELTKKYRLLRRGALQIPQ